MVITWTDANLVATIFDNSNPDDYLIDKVSGLENPEGVIIDQQAPFQHGVTALRAQLGKRIIGIEFLFHSKVPSEVEDMRLLLGEIFSPVAQDGSKNAGVLEFEMVGGTYTIGAIPQSFQHPPRTAPDFYRSLVNLACPDPLFETTQESTALSEGTPITITNGGKFLSYPIIKIVGPLDTPRITNQETGKYIELTDFVLASGHRLEIDFRVGQKTIYDVTIADNSRVSVFEYLSDPATEFWPLLVADNDILYESADNGGTATIYWTEKFLAIG